jgi:polysaccharide export outer membrane protein
VPVVLQLLAGTILLLLMVGCAPTYRDLAAGTRVQFGGEGTSAMVERQEVAVALPEDETQPSADYRIGAGDVLFININGKAEFQNIPQTGSSKISGSRVDGSGRVAIPLVGYVEVAGLTLPEAQKKVRESLLYYLKDPWVVIEVAEFKSLPVYLLGSFKAPGIHYLDRPLNLLQGISLGGGFDTNANLRGARLSRAGKVQPVDIYALLTNGDQRQNVWLKSGDTVYLPDKSLQQVFVFGSVKKPGPVQMLNGQLTLAQAIAAVELREIGYDLAHVRIIRSLSTTRGELLVVDFERMMRGQALPFTLQEGDIVYVPRSGLGSWNDAIAEMLPSLQAISSMLQPFVSIKYLSE